MPDPTSDSTPDTAARQPVCIVDRNGKRYTTAVAGSHGDWWYGATILTRPESVHRLLDDGLGPLREIDPATGKVIAEITGVREQVDTRPMWLRGLHRLWGAP